MDGRSRHVKGDGIRGPAPAQRGTEYESINTAVDARAGKLKARGTAEATSRLQRRVTRWRGTPLGAEKNSAIKARAVRIAGGDGVRDRMVIVDRVDGLPGNE